MRTCTGFPAAVLAVWLAGSGLANAAAPAPDDMAEARRWTSARFEGVGPALSAEGTLLVLANHDEVHRNARGNKPLNLAGKTFTHGLYCHAVSKVVVRLPGPGKT